MALTYTGTGGLFTRLGAIIAGMNEVQNQIDGTTVARVLTIFNQYLTTDQQVLTQSSSNLIPGAANYQATPAQWLILLNNLMQNTIIQQVYDAYPTLNPTTLTQALNIMIADMTENSQSISKPTMSLSVTPIRANGNANYGNGVLTAAIIDVDGLQLDYAFAETLTATCTNDSYSGSATQDQEPFQMLGQLAATIYQYNYPLGSGNSATVTTLDTLIANTSNLFVPNGDFESWSGSGPYTANTWSIIVGSAGNPPSPAAGTISRDATNPYTGTYDMQLNGNGSLLLNVATPVAVEPLTVYGANVYAALGTAASGFGTTALRMSLVDTNGNIINNPEGNPCSFSVACTGGMNTNYQSLASLALSNSAVPFFTTPAILPTATGGAYPGAVNLRVDNTIYAIPSGKTIHLDDVGLQDATQAYQGGPWTAIWCGSTSFQISDAFRLQINNTNSVYNSYTAPTTFTRQLARYLGLTGLGSSVPPGTKIPSSLSPTIADTLITNCFPSAPLTFTVTTAGSGGNANVSLTSSQTGATTYNLYVDGAALTAPSATYTYAQLLSGQVFHSGSGNHAFQLASVNPNGQIGALTIVQLAVINA